MGHQEHRSAAPAKIGAAILTISDTRTEADDRSGALARELLQGAGHEVCEYRIVRDEPAEVRAAVEALARRHDVRAILLNGGTGISRRDRTYEAVASVLERRLDGFGELFRALSYQDIGSAAMLSRAVAGIIGGKVLFSVPGSPAAVRLALERLILPELGHLVSELDR
jgi:molybdenum cofactor biosynthesis protein B